MNAKITSAIALLAMIVMTLGQVEAHKKFLSAPLYESPERCLCECGGGGRPVLPNTPYHGSAGYAQPRPQQGGYGNAGSYAVAGSYGSGSGTVNGGY